jgi:hypothetical protein
MAQREPIGRIEPPCPNETTEKYQNRSLLFNPLRPAPLLATRLAAFKLRRGYQMFKPIRKDVIIVLPDGAGVRSSQVTQEVQYILLVGCTQHIERVDHLVGF